MYASKGKFAAFRPFLTDMIPLHHNSAGQGFTLFKGFPTTKDYPVEVVAVAYMGIGSHLGAFLSQNGKGHILGDDCQLYICFLRLTSFSRSRKRSGE